MLAPPLHVLLAYTEAADVWVEALIKDSVDLPTVLPSPEKREGVWRKAPPRSTTVKKR